MDVHLSIASRRTIQRFVPGPVPDEVLERGLLAAVHAPNHKTTWPFRFVLCGPEAREALFRVGLRLKAAKKGGPTPELERQVRDAFFTPDRLVVVAQQLAEDAGRALEDYATCACAVQNLLLAVHADGFGGKWETGGVARDPEAFAALGLDPSHHRIVAIVWLGVPERIPTGPVRPPLAELVVRR